MSNTHTTDIAIIGAGPVGLFAVFQAGMLRMQCHVIDALDHVGGQCTALYPEKPIYDIPAYPSIMAQDLVERLSKQADPMHPTYHLGQQVTHVEKTDGGWHLTTSKGTHIHAKAIFIAAGCGAFGPNRPPLDGIEAFEAQAAGTGVHYMVQRREDFRDKSVVIAGGGDSAVDWALSLSEVARSIYVVHRRDKFRALPESVHQMRTLANEGKIELVVPYQLAGLEGTDGTLTGVTVKTLKGEARTLTADALLPFYGLAMTLGPIADWGLSLTQNHITVNPKDCSTNQTGIFAMGDIATYDGKLKLILCGFSEAAMACHAAHAIVHPDTALHFEYSTSKGVDAL